MATIDQNDPELYEHLTLIIQEYEEEAIKSENRNALLAIAHGITTSYQSVLDAAKQILTKNSFQKISEGNIPIVGEDAFIDLSNVTFDKDLQAISGVDNLQDYLKECAACDLRINFEWQIQPVNLLEPIKDLLSSITSSLDAFKEQFNSLANLEKLCDLLNNTQWICLPDLASLLIGIKVLLKSYLKNQISIRLDWTVVLGPLLKGILSGISSMIESAANILLGPLDCLNGVIRSIGEIEKQAINTANTAAGVVQQLSKTTSSITKNGIGTEPIYVNVKETDNSVKFSKSKENKKSNKDKYDEWSFPAGMSLNENMSLEEALAHPAFQKAHWSSKLAVTIQNAKMYIINLVKKVVDSFKALQGLVSGGLNFSLGNLGLILFLKDMVALVMLMMKSFKNHKNIKDWCSYLETNPESFSNLINETFGTNINLTVQQDNILITQKGNPVGVIKTCDLSTKTNNQMRNWIEQMDSGK